MGAGRCRPTDPSPATTEPMDTARGSPASASAFSAGCSCSGAHTITIPIPMLNVRSMSSSGTLPAWRRNSNSRGGVHAPSHLQARGGRKNSRQVVRDAAAGDVRHPLDQPRRAAAVATAGRYDRCGASSASPTVSRSPGTAIVDASLQRRTRCGARVNSRWCADRGRQPDQHVAGRRSTAVDQSVAASTTPTMKPATSYSPSA